MITEDGKLITPFTDDQVRSINTFQESGAFHPFTCPKCGSTLKATTVGINCYVCGKWFQTWVHVFMADWSWQGPALGRISVLDNIWARHPEWRSSMVEELKKVGIDPEVWEKAIRKSPEDQTDQPEGDVPRKVGMTGDDLGAYELDLSWPPIFNHRKFGEDAESGIGRFWLVRMPGAGMERFRGVLLPEYIRIFLDFGADFAYLTIPRGQTLTPLEVAKEVARALGAKRLLKDGVEVVM